MIAASRYKGRYKYDEISTGLKERIVSELKEISINRNVFTKDKVHLFTSYNREYILCKKRNGWVITTIIVHPDKKEFKFQIKKLLNKSKK